MAFDKTSWTDDDIALIRKDLARHAAVAADPATDPRRVGVVCRLLRRDAEELERAMLYRDAPVGGAK